MTRKWKVVTVEETTGSMSAMEAMPSRFAQDRAKRDPQPGDRWTEMLSWWCHVDARDGDRVLTRAYVGPCEIEPSQAKESKWHETLEDFANYVRAARFDGNALWAVKAGGATPVDDSAFGSRSRG